MALRLLLIACCVSCGLEAQAESRPNFLLFIADNWAWPHAGVLGDPTAQTPVFDRIAREGVLFEHAFCPVPSCSPTRSCLLTGRPAHQLEEAASLWSAFPRKLKVFTQQLREAGYEVGYCGKGWSPGNYLDSGWAENPVGTQYKNLTEFLQARDPAKPFFFWSGNTDTSLNKWRYEPEGWAGLDPQSLRIPPMLPDHEETRLSLLGYYGAVSRVDADAGRCVAALEDTQLLNDTVVVYTSDNGWQMPRGLANCYDTGTRIPFAVRWGNQLKAGRRVDEFISLIDLAPTFLELAGVALPAEMTGRSFVDVLMGKSSTVPRDHVFIERERHANVRRGNLSYPIRGIRTRDYLYLWNLRPERWPAGDPEVYFAVGEFGDVDGSRAKQHILAQAELPEMQRYFDLNFAKRPAAELYDLRSDPDQLVNVAGQSEYAAALRELHTRVEDWMRDTADPRVDPTYDAWDEYPYFGKPVAASPATPVDQKR